MKKRFLSDFRFAVSAKSNCIWTADRWMGGDVSCSFFSIREINEDSLLWHQSTPFTKGKDLRNDRFHRHAGRAFDEVRALQDGVLPHPVSDADDRLLQTLLLVQLRLFPGFLFFPRLVIGEKSGWSALSGLRLMAFSRFRKMLRAFRQARSHRSGAPYGQSRYFSAFRWNTFS